MRRCSSSSCCLSWSSAAPQGQPLNLGGIPVLQMPHVAAAWVKYGPGASSSVALNPTGCPGKTSGRFKNRC